MVPVPLAYKYVAIAAMLAEINFTAARLGLKTNHPITEQDIKNAIVVHPSELGFGGRIDTKDYAFSFVRNGHLRYITRLQEGTAFAAGIQPPEGVSLEDYFDALSRKRSLIGTNEAYHLAKGWLSKLDVDVSRLERETSPSVEQLKNRSSKPLPLFEVKWFGRLKPSKHIAAIVNATIAGDTMEPLSIRQEDDSYSGRPRDLIKDVQNLLAITDSEFATYSSTQRSNLVSRFLNVQ
jgi:hypothetical protein